MTYDGGQTWHVIKANIINSGSYDISVPDIPGAEFRIRLVGTGTTSIIAQSGEIKIQGETRPIIISGGQSTVESGSTIDLTWATNSDQPSEVTLQISTDGGLTFTTAQSGIINSGSLSYLVPENTVGPVLLQIIDDTKNVVLAQSFITVIEKLETGLSGFSITNGGNLSTGEIYSAIMTVGDPVQAKRLSNSEGTVFFQSGLIGVTE